MRLIVSGHFVFTGRVGGAEHMFYNLLRGLWTAGATIDLLCADPRNLDPEFLDAFGRKGRGRIVPRGSYGPRFVAEQVACLDRNLTGDAILFPNYAVPPFVPRRLGTVGVVIHDFQYRHFPANFSAKKRGWLRWSHKWAFTAADKVVLISNFVLRDAIKFYGDAVEKSVVIPNPISWERFATNPSPHPFDGRPYVLTVAAQYPHKRTDLLLRAFAEVARRDPEVTLVLAGQVSGALIGSVPSAVDLKGLIGELRLRDRVHVTGYMTDAQLGNLYRHATMFAFPSAFEGFGMPAVEALGFGLPTLTTDCTALPESTLGVATYVEQDADAPEWADRMMAMISRPAEYRPSAAQIAAVRDRYSPHRIAREYLAALAQ